MTLFDVRVRYLLFYILSACLGPFKLVSYSNLLVRFETLLLPRQKPSSFYLNKWSRRLYLEGKVQLIHFHMKNTVYSKFSVLRLNNGVTFVPESLDPHHCILYKSHNNYELTFYPEKQILFLNRCRCLKGLLAENTLFHSVLCKLSLHKLKMCSLNSKTSLPPY